MRTALGPELSDLLRGRASVRRFTSDEVPDELVADVLAQAMRAPTAFNFQPYSFIVVRDRRLTAELAAVAGGQPHVRDAPVLIVVCAEIARVARHSGCDPDGEDAELERGCVIDAALAGMCASLAAESLGLGTVLVGGVRNDPGRVRELLGIPEGVLVAFGLCLGWPAERPPARPRTDPSLGVHRERYDPALAELAGRYDSSMLRGPGGEVTAGEAEAWRREIAKGVGRVRRMRAAVRPAPSPAR